MPRRKRRKKNKKKLFNREKRDIFSLPEETKQWIGGILLVLVAIIIGLSFFDRAGIAGYTFMKGSRFLIGETIFIAPLIFILSGLILLGTKKDMKGSKLLWPIALGIILLLSGSAGLLGIFNPLLKTGGWLGYLLGWPLLKYFGFWAAFFIFLAPIAIGCLIFWQFLQPVAKKKEEEKEFKPEVKEIDEPEKPSIMKKIFAPKFKVEGISSDSAEPKMEEKVDDSLKLETKSVAETKVFSYQPPPLSLLEKQSGVPTSGDTKTNSTIIKKTFEHFGVDVAMSEINIGPTVTQYTFKPAEGIKLTKITGLSNDLSLALAVHPIRIEAPIPGRSLVGVEIPNKVRAQVRLRELIENPSFQKSTASLNIPLGKDVSGFPVYTDLTKMPHLLVAGATGTGKTIFLNSLILSLLYQPSTPFKSAGPETIRLILIDPKKVEFPIFSGLPHLLCPVICNATQTVNALSWLTGEMERRFDVLAKAGARDIRSFNELSMEGGNDPLPFIVVVIDELADLMAAKGKEMEAGIVRLAQMARAVGVHLVIATQRPSVEVITGTIKANITSRITFQVASQVDSRTIIDSSGAEKLLGRGDLLYISAQVPKPKRIQGAFSSDKEVRKVIKHIISNAEEPDEDGITSNMDQNLIQELNKGLEDPNKEVVIDNAYDGDDALYSEAKKLVIESKKASASLLQRRLRLGYARAARLIDMLETNGVVGPAEGAKPREVYGDIESIEAGAGVPTELDDQDSSGEPEEWNKI